MSQATTRGSSVQQAERSDPAGEDWTLPGPFGAELWHRAAGRFEAVSCAGERIVLPTDPVTGGRLRLRGSACPHPGPFPTAFRHCPECGAALSAALGAAPGVPDAETWSPPFGTVDGLPSLDDRRLPDPDSLQEIASPASAALGFAVAGTPPMLLACDRAGGWVSAWSEATQGWIERVQIAACTTLPAWSWSASAGPRGMALPTDRGPAWIALSRPRGAPVTVLDGVWPLGGAVLLREQVAVPVWREAGLALAVLDHGGAAPEWRLVAVQGAPPAPVAVLAAPTVAGDLAGWCGAEGLLTLQSTADGPVARWRGWRDGVRPLPGVRPVMERNGTLHQLARLDSDTLVWEGLSAPGQVQERRASRGYVLSSGRAVYREAARLRSPSDERETADFPLPDDHFLVPLLALDAERAIIAVCSDRAGLGAFVGDAGVAPRMHRCVLHLSRGARSLEPLGGVFRAQHAWQLGVFIHDGWLHAHGALENRLLRWRLRDAG